MNKSVAILIEFIVTHIEAGSRHLPPGIILAQKKCTGRHWKIAVKIKERVNVSTMAKVPKHV